MLIPRISPAFPPRPLHVYCLPQLHIFLLLWVFVCLFFPLLALAYLFVSHCLGGRNPLHQNTSDRLLRYMKQRSPFCLLGKLQSGQNRKTQSFGKKIHSAPSRARDTHTMNTDYCSEVNCHNSGGGGK